MPFVNYMTREIHLRIAYCGPYLAGKATYLRHVRQTLARATLQAPEDPPYAEDELFYFGLTQPLELGKLRGFSTLLELYLIPDAITYQGPRLEVFCADGFLFVADAQINQRTANLAALDRLYIDLKSQDINPEETSLVFQYNKQDLPYLLPIEALERELNPSRRPAFETIAITGEGVLDALKTCVKEVLRGITTGSAPVLLPES
ncbi:MAG: GTPase domain-containing protein [Myxococcales bacterium]|nr:GTPase domain-containing protein [Polyangiaceae bacterium]MDW8249644.1 GTPase domain-containing protein [Myxococcales bacterium]